MPSYAVTGCSRNIGRALVKILSEDSKNTIFALSRSPIPQDLSNRSNVHEIYMNQADLTSMRTAIDQVKNLSGGNLDCLICNAGVGQLDHVPLAEGREEELGEKLTSALSVNTVGMVQLVSSMLPLLRSGEQKRILVLTSGHGVAKLVRESKFVGGLPYGVSKAASDMVMLRLHNELGPEGFIIASVSPSCVHSEESASANGIKDFEGFKKMIESKPDSSGVFAPEEGVKIILDTFGRMRPEDGGRVVGMWGSEDKFL